MGKYFNGKILSVGYNSGYSQLQTQTFFDILNEYSSYIHSYFFSLSHALNNGRYIPKEIIEKLKKANTYNIPGNLLFNTTTYYNKDIGVYSRLINAIKDYVNLKAVTVLSYEDGKTIKESFPELEVHLSIRFWDYNIARIKEYSFSDMSKYIDVINTSGSRSYNDHNLCKDIHDTGMKVKFIVNEGCIVGQDSNYNNFLEADSSCKDKKILDCLDYKSESERFNIRCSQVCKKTCDKVYQLYPWMELCRTNIFKESLQYFDYDILKISTRYANLDYVRQELEYWTSDETTSYLFNNIYDSLPGIKDHYDTFLRYIEERSKCKCDCYHCRKCEKFYKEFKGE